MNIAPISSNNQTFQCRKGKKFTKDLKKFCDKVIDRIERSTTSVAQAKLGLIDPFRDSGSYTKRRMR